MGFLFFLPTRAKKQLLKPIRITQYKETLPQAALKNKEIQENPLNKHYSRMKEL